jgi:hypothetical protein
VCKGAGELNTHSRLETASTSVCVLKYSGAAHGFEAAGTFATNASYIMYKNTKTATNDIRLPTELIAFHPAYASG